MAQQQQRQQNVYGAQGSLKQSFLPSFFSRSSLSCIPSASVSPQRKDTASTANQNSPAITAATASSLRPQRKGRSPQDLYDDFPEKSRKKARKKVLLQMEMEKKTDSIEMERKTDASEMEGKMDPSKMERKRDSSLKRMPTDNNGTPMENSKSNSQPAVSERTLSSIPAPGKTDYELEREENIKRNNEFLKSLGIPTSPLRAPLRPKVKPQKTLETPIIGPLRRSARKQAKSLKDKNCPESQTLDTIEKKVPSSPVKFEDSSVHRYVVSFSSLPSKIAENERFSTDGDILGLRLVGRTMLTPRSTKIYALDVASVGSCILLTAGGHAGMACIFGPRLEHENFQKLGEEDSLSPLISWKASYGWISGLKLLVDSVGVRLLSSGNDGRLLLWDICREGPSEMVFEGHSPVRLAQTDELHTNGIFGMAEMNRRIATASKDSSVGLSRIGSSGFEVERLFSGHHHGVVRGVSFRNYDSLADCGADNKICILDPRQHDMCTLSINSDHGSGVNMVDWCPSQEHLLLSASKDPEILLYDIRNPETYLYSLKGHVDPRITQCYQIYKPAFIGSGTAVATTGQGSKCISLYDVRDGKPISQGDIGFNGHLVMCKSEDSSLSQRVWIAGRHVNQLLPVWKTTRHDIVE